jgi:hypothetical protein
VDDGGAAPNEVNVGAAAAAAGCLACGGYTVVFDGVIQPG